MIDKTITILKISIVLAIFFLLLKSDISDGAIIEAILFSAATLGIYCKFIPFSRSGKFRLRFLYCLPWILKEIILSSFVMAKIILFSKVKDVMPVIGKVKNDQNSTVGKVIFANFITLTPGTISIAYDENYLSIHAISKEHLSSLKKTVMDNLIMKSYQ